ncbi:hypothetical protein QBC32DRAFT_214360 [Pseudoneurospora amorphoporcata]|uniref:Uncharacterized protein n=1 Tax=Pseudoneurospora amorphoporcata TaxID=241081 RepID=A0AAN6SG30_9PEZI|nr:hypothetical protein QBC32DRAFT_214360 [Pseudoneurospora amorphoporcata]
MRKKPREKKKVHRQCNTVRHCPKALNNQCNTAPHRRSRHLVNELHDEPLEPLSKDPHNWVVDNVIGPQKRAPLWNLAENEISKDDYRPLTAETTVAVDNGNRRLFFFFFFFFFFGGGGESGILNSVLAYKPSCSPSSETPFRKTGDDG